MEGSSDRDHCYAVDIDAQELGKNYLSVVSLMGDAKVTLRKFIEAPGPAKPREECLNRVQGYVKEWRSEVAAQRDSDAVPIRPERICREITEF